MPNDFNILSYLEAGIRAESAKQQSVASNVANLDTPGYRRIDVNFQQLLKKVIDSGEKFDPDSLEFEYFKPKNTPVKSNGNDVSLDSEVSDMVKNSLRQSTYVRLLKKKYEMISLAMRTSG